LDEAAALKNISFMPARVKCAVLGWHTMEEMLKNGKTSAMGSAPHCSTES
ncbi:MAG TPA: SUF system NifU family Fe-S cluster assembly protein, partial [Treponema sp.]|nr:SUF system NifU family Fe-S cluster assembly protein [Treponema sp.]